MASPQMACNIFFSLGTSSSHTRLFFVSSELQIFSYRRDAQKLPNVNSVPNPYAASDAAVIAARMKELTTASSAISKGGVDVDPNMPSTEWRERFVQRFKNMRKVLYCDVLSIRDSQLPHL